MPSLRRAIALTTLFAFLCATSFAQGNTWKKVRYNGGTLQTKVDPEDWGNKLTVSSETVTLVLKDG